MSGSSCVPNNTGAVRSQGAWWPLKTCIFRRFGAQKTISSYSFDRIILIFGYIVQRSNSKILSSHFFCNFHLEPKLWRHKWRNFRFCKSCRRAMRFPPLDSSEDFVGELVSVSLYLLEFPSYGVINDVIMSDADCTRGREPRSVAGSLVNGIPRIRFHCISQKHRLKCN